MKTREVTVQRIQERSFEMAMYDCKSEYGALVGDDVLDEMAMAEIDDSDE